MIQLMIFNLFYLVLLIVQWGIIPLFSIGNVQPNILLLYLIFWSWHHSRGHSVLAGFFSGLMFDVLGGGFWGQQGLVQSISAYLAATLHAHRFGMRFMIVFALVFFLAAIHELIHECILCWHDLGLLPSLVLRYILPSAIYTATTGILVQLLIERVTRRRKYI